MSRLIILICLLSCINSAQAHQPDVSTTLLIETAPGKWIAEIKASLTAFEYEVGVSFPDSTFNSPEEFKQMVISHLKNHLFISLNQEDNIGLHNPQVRLGHETSVYFELPELPQNFQYLSVKNSSFQNIYHNQSILVILKEGFSQDRFFLDNSNSHSLLLTTEGNKFELATTDTGSGSWSYLIFLPIGITLFAGGLIWTNTGKKKVSTVYRH